jgi:hypothetical protein
MILQRIAAFMFDGSFVRDRIDESEIVVEGDRGSESGVCFHSPIGLDKE